MEAHNDVAFSLGGDSRDELVGTEGPVAEGDVPFVDVFQEARSNAGVVLSKATGFKSFDPAMTEVDHSDDAHDGEAASFFLTTVLGIAHLVFRRVHEGHGGAVDGLEGMPPP